MTERGDFRYDILGTRFRVICDAPSIGSRLESLLEPFSALNGSHHAAEVSFSVGKAADGGVWLRTEPDNLWTGPEEVLLGRLIGELNSLALERSPHLAVHCGVVAVRGGAVAFPARSGGGKSTLTAACIQAGFAYVSDEALCLDRTTGGVVPYPKPLSLTSAALRRLGLERRNHGGDQELLHAKDLGGSVVEGQPRLAHVVMIERSSTKVELVPLSRSEAIASIIGFSFNHYKDPVGSFRVTVEAGRGCAAWRLFYDDPVEAAALLRSELVGTISPR